MKDEQYWMVMSGLAPIQSPEPIVEAAKPEAKTTPAQPEAKPRPEEAMWLEFAGLTKGGPIPPAPLDTLGKDQEMNPIPLGVTFTPEDIEELAAMKIKLHELGDKACVADTEDKPEKADKIREKIEKLTAEIDEFSDMLGRPYNPKE